MLEGIDLDVANIKCLNVASERRIVEGEARPRRSLAQRFVQADTKVQASKSNYLILKRFTYQRYIMTRFP